MDDYLGKGEVLTNTDLDRFVRNIWKIWAFCVHRKCLRSLSSAHEKWGQKQQCCVYNFGQCNSSIDHHLGQRVWNLFWPKSQFFYFWLMHFSKTTYIYIKSNQIKSNHFYCHITTAQVPWWVKFLWACSRQCRKTTDNLHMDRQCKKKQKTIYIWTDSAKNCTGAFTVLQTVQKKNNNSNLHMDRQCKKNNNSNLHMDRQCKKNNSNLHMDSTYLQTVQKTMCKIHIHELSTLSVL